MFIYTHDDCLLHKPYPVIAEKARRLEELHDLFNEQGSKVIQNKMAEIEWLEYVHSSQYIDEIKSISQSNPVISAYLKIKASRKNIQWYTRISPGTYNAALYAAGAVCHAVEDIIEGKTNRAFCAIRPPGHHAGPENCEGFCVFNNVAIGAFHALNNGFKKVAIVDFDTHHANGTQKIIEHKMNDSILLASSYEEKCKYYQPPKKEALAQNIIGVSLTKGSNYAVIKEQYEKYIIPALYEFNPDLIMISAGFDMHEDDPLTNLKMTSPDFYLLTKMLVGAANDLCDGRIVSSLEGGYEIKALRECVSYHLEALKM